ncbi:MAG: ATP-binding cassette domain-containing protein [Lactobacillales bacterium]|nr:ATP-binding cassette domain-containing protein [Lactobacillales bacterium]
MDIIKKISIKHLNFSYGEQLIFEDAHFNLSNGDIACLSGDNGSGKTTLLKLLSGLIYFKGHFETLIINNQVIANEELKKKLIFIPSKPKFYEKINYQDNIEIIRYLWSQDQNYCSKVKQMLKKLYFNLTNEKELESYSLGMRCKLALACFFSIDVPLILLDEPLGALDMKSRERMIHIMKTQAKAGRIFLFSSHSEDFKKQLANKIFQIKDQKLLISKN